VIGFVVVSHSEALAEAAVDLAMQMIHGEAPPVRIASGQTVASARMRRPSPTPSTRSPTPTAC
jgi:hypothetical protein